MTINQLDKFRAVANHWMDEKRRFQGEPGSFEYKRAAAYYRFALDVADKAVMEWVGQGCTDFSSFSIPTAGVQNLLVWPERLDLRKFGPTKLDCGNSDLDLFEDDLVCPACNEVSTHCECDVSF